MSTMNQIKVLFLLAFIGVQPLGLFSLESGAAKDLTTLGDTNAEAPAEALEDPLIVEEESVDNAILQTQAGSVTVISREQLEQSGARTIAEAMHQVEGIFLTRYGSMGQSVSLSMRGSSHQQILILVDGNRLNPSLGGGGDLDAIPLEMIDRIEVIRGAASARYGPDAMGGVIHIITRSDKNDHKPLMIVKSGAGSYHTGMARFFLLNPISKRHPFYYWLNGETAFSGANYTFEDQKRGTIETRHNSGFWNERIAFKASSVDSKRSKNTGWTASVLQSYKDAGVPGTLEFPTLRANQKDLLAHGLLEAKWGWMDPFLFQTISAGYMLQHRLFTDQFYEQRSEQEIERHTNQSVHVDSVLSSRLGRYMASIGVTEHAEWLDSTGLEKKGGYPVEGWLQRFQTSLYSAGQIHLIPFYKITKEIKGRIIVLPSLRIDNHFRPDLKPSKQWDWFPSYQIGILWNMDADSRYFLKTSFQNAYRIPSFSELFWSETSFAKGNPDLLPEQVLGGEAGFYVQPIKVLKASVNAFYNHYWDMIVWNPGVGGQWRPSNLGESLGYGGEAEGSYLWFVNKLRGTIEFRGNYSLQFLLDQTADHQTTYNKQLPHKPHEKIAGKITYAHRKGHYGWVSGRYVGFRYQNASNTAIIDPYFVLDASVAVKINRFLISAVVFNILNTTYVDLIEYPIPGIEWMAQVTWNL